MIREIARVLERERGRERTKMSGHRSEIWNGGKLWSNVITFSRWSLVFNVISGSRGETTKQRKAHRALEIPRNPEPSPPALFSLSFMQVGRERNVNADRETKCPSISPTRSCAAHKFRKEERKEEYFLFVAIFPLDRAQGILLHWCITLIFKREVRQRTSLHLNIDVNTFVLNLA